MHYEQLVAGGVMAERDGWQRPVRYTSVQGELAQVRRAVGLSDISPNGKLKLQGADLGPMLSGALGDMKPLEGGVVQLHSLGDGNAARSVVLAALAWDEILVLTAPGQASSVAGALGLDAGPCAHAVDVTSGMAGVGITGPLAPSLLASVTEVDISPDAFPNMSCAQGRFAEVYGALLRMDVGRLPSYELYFNREFGEYLWDALRHAGEEYDLTLFGVEAMMRLAQQ